MPTTERFFVSKENKIKRSTKTDRDLLKAGDAKYVISVFGDNHKKTAAEIKDMVDNAKMSDRLFSISIETR
jgi:hypothetical protein